MNDWQPEDPGMLQFEFNECTPREFWEVFGVEPALARSLHEYRLEVLHVMNLDQLLTLKGVSQELLQHWSDPQPNGSFDAKLQQDLGLQTDTPEPLPDLLDAACKSIGASSCLMARDGSILMKSTVQGASFELPTTEILEVFRPICDSMFQMNLPNVNVLVIGLAASDLIFLSAGGISIATTQPRGRLDSTSLQLWNGVAGEVRRRCPPRMHIDKHAAVGENDIAFECPQCVLRIVVDRVAIGCSFSCPRCQAAVTVPDQTTSASSRILPPAPHGPAEA